MPFIGELQYERLDGKESFVGRPVFRLTKYFSYVCDETDCQTLIECEEGFETDFASIPEWIVFLNPRHKKWKEASVIHDKACLMAKAGLMTYRIADLTFYYAMRERNASIYAATFLWFFTRLNHLILLKG